MDSKGNGTSDGDAGKYSIKPKIRSAGFGDISVTELMTTSTFDTTSDGPLEQQAAEAQALAQGEKIGC